MADEKYIGSQNTDKDIMVKCFVTFEDIKDICKNRRQLVNRSVFSCYSSKAWPKFMDFIAMKYDFSKIKNICLLADGGSWIKSGISELKLDTNNSVKFYLCEFHFKQAIHHITTDSDERYYLLHIFNTKPKYYFIDSVNTIIKNNSKRKDIINKKLKYIINNYSNIKLNNELIVADIYDLGEENLKYGMYILIDIFWDAVKKDRKEKKAIYLDEIWRLIGVTSNKYVASFIYKIFKTIRKYGGSGVAITQDISDIFSLENGTYGKSILNNSSIKTFFALEEENIKILGDYANLSEKEKIEIKSLKRGECLMFVGEDHILTKIQSSEKEKEIIEGENMKKI